jgi:hypothetical protein
LNEYDKSYFEGISENGHRLPGFHSRSQPQIPKASLPDSLANMPDLFPHLELVWIIFSMVRNSRLISEFGVGHIPLGEITTILNEFHIDDSDTRIYYIRLIQAIDSAYMQYLMKLRK